MCLSSFGDKCDCEQYDSEENEYYSDSLFLQIWILFWQLRRPLWGIVWYFSILRTALCLSDRFPSISVFASKCFYFYLSVRDWLGFVPTSALDCLIWLSLCRFVDWNLRIYSNFSLLVSAAWQHWLCHKQRSFRVTYLECRLQSGLLDL